MSKRIKPFLKWAGGKTQLLPVLTEKLPDNMESLKRYVEPFVGAGAMFFNLAKLNHFEEYIISDINDKLINLYSCIRDDAEALIKELSALRQAYVELEDLESKSEFFYERRKEFNATTERSVRLAALFVFLNKTCFNGLYRENAKGEFNVPFNNAINPSMFEEEQLREISRLLNIKNEAGKNKVQILNKSFEALEDYIDKSTFVYLDPPYRPVTKGGFNTYNKSSFNDAEQEKLAHFYRKLSEKGAYLMLSNSDPKNLDAEDEFFDRLYEGFNMMRVNASRMINSDAKGRGKVTELLVCNYKIAE